VVVEEDHIHPVLAWSLPGVTREEAIEREEDSDDGATPCDHISRVLRARGLLGTEAVGVEILQWAVIGGEGLLVERDEHNKQALWHAHKLMQQIAGVVAQWVAVGRQHR
jgi:hypothetical protein